MKRGMAVAGLIVVTAIWGGGFVASDIHADHGHPIPAWCGADELY